VDEPVEDGGGVGRIKRSYPWDRRRRVRHSAVPEAIFA
jgi:hypothetical protein